MNRTKRTMAVALAQISSVFVQSILVLFVTRSIIGCIGSDYNGLSSTATQLLMFLSLIEGGFTLATLVKLYTPYNNKDFGLLSKYVSLSNKKFKQIGISYLIFGTIIAFISSFFIKTNATNIEVIIIVMLVVISSSFSIFYVSKFRLLYQVSQSEYVIYTIQTIIYVFMYLIEIVVINIFRNIILANTVVMVFQLLFGFLIGIDAKKRFKNIDYNSDYKNIEISGTSDVFISKISGLFYSAAPVIFISTFIGTSFTSVYAVYNSVLSVISNIINVVLISPRNALGQLIYEKDTKRLNDIYNEYECLSVISIILLCTTTFALIIPFIRLYTLDISDVNYINSWLAILLVSNTVLQMLHIPSGTCIEVAGHFKVVKKLQACAAFIIASFSICGAYLIGVYGILFAKLCASLFLCFMEIYYTRKRILKSPLKVFFQILIPNIIVGLLLSTIEYILLLNTSLSFFTFIVYGFLLLTLNSISLVFINFIFNRVYLKKIFTRFKLLFVERKKIN